MGHAVSGNQRNDGGRSARLLFLKYSLVYPFSGLPADIGFLQAKGAGIIGDRKGWQELDIHGAIHIVRAAVDNHQAGTRDSRDLFIKYTG